MLDINNLVAELIQLVSGRIKSRKGLHAFVEEVVKPYVETTCDRFMEKKVFELKAMFENVLSVLPNGKQGVPYEVNIPLSADLLEMLQEYVTDPLTCTCEVVESIGLSCEWSEDLSTIRLFGVPTVYGESVGLTLRFNFVDSQNMIQTADSYTTFVVAADPKKLWNNIPTPPDIPFYKADEFCSAEFVEGEKRIVAASKRGRSHAHTGKPRDDHFEYTHLDNGWYVLAVADGAGSAEYSREGSKVACRTVVQHCAAKLADSEKLDEAIWGYYDCEVVEGTENLPENEEAPSADEAVEMAPTDCVEASEEGTEMQVAAAEQPDALPVDKQQLKDFIGKSMFETLGHAAYKAHQAIKATADSVQRRTRDFATTMLITICKKFGEKGWFVASYWVGDGAVGIYTEGEAGPELQLMGEPDGGEFAGQTRFLVMPEVVTAAELVRRIRVSFVKDFSALMLMTDGVSDPMFDTDANLLSPDKWKDLWENLNEEVPFADAAVATEELSEKLLAWLDFWAVGNHDDRTILVVY